VILESPLVHVQVFSGVWIRNPISLRIVYLYAGRSPAPRHRRDEGGPDRGPARHPGGPGRSEDARGGPHGSGRSRQGPPRLGEPLRRAWAGLFPGPVSLPTY
jgi:hypothetical protein